MLRVMGKKFGLSCLFLDFLKGLIPVILGISLLQIEGRVSQMALPLPSDWVQTLSSERQTFVQAVHIFIALLAILGHNYSPWIGFKGGKGIATSAGVLVALMPMALFILILIWGILFITTRYVSVASIGAAISLPILTHLGARFHHISDEIDAPSLWEAGTWNKPLFIFSVVISALAIWKHRSNLKKLLNGTENRFTRKKKA